MLSNQPLRRRTMLALGGCAALFGCGGNDKPTEVRLVNEPGKVELASRPGSTDNELWTTFRIEDSTHPTAIASPGTGGACLVADLNAHGLPVMSAPRRCTKNADCQGGLGVVGSTEGWWGYCDIEGDKKCWIRPGKQPELCKVGPQPKDVDVETPHFPITAAFKARFPGPLRWRAVACLNGYNGSTNRDCGLMDGGVRREVMGTPRAVP